MRNTAKVRSDLPGVGDFVAVRLGAAGDDQATIEAVLPRTSALIRKASGKSRPQLLAANIDIVFIMTAPDADLNLPRLERYLALVRSSGATPMIVVNKADLAHDVVEVTDRIASIAFGVSIHAVSARSLTSISVLERFFDGNRTIALVGSSGVGKSTLTNLLLGRAAQATQEVRAYDSRGRHTTTHRQLFTRLGGGSIVDTPGMRALEAWQAPARRWEQLQGYRSRVGPVQVQRLQPYERTGMRSSRCRRAGEPDGARADSHAALARIETERSVIQRAWRH